MGTAVVRVFVGFASGRKAGNWWIKGLCTVLRGEAPRKEPDRQPPGVLPPWPPSRREAALPPPAPGRPLRPSRGNSPPRRSQGEAEAFYNSSLANFPEESAGEENGGVFPATLPLRATQGRPPPPLHAALCIRGKPTKTGIRTTPEPSSQSQRLRTAPSTVAYTRWHEEKPRRRKERLLPAQPRSSGGALPLSPPI